MERRLWILVLVAMCGAGVVYIVTGPAWIGIIFIAAGVALSWWVSPWKGGRSVRYQEVMALPPEQRPVVIYWKPGCKFCARLKRTLGDHSGTAIWVNIWQDKEAAEFVRSANDGNETVPTVVMGSRTLTNPDPENVLSRLTA